MEIPPVDAVVPLLYASKLKHPSIQESITQVSYLHLFGLTLYGGLKPLNSKRMIDVIGG